VWKIEVPRTNLRKICQNIKEIAHRYNQFPEKGDEHITSFVNPCKVLYSQLLPDKLKSELHKIDTPIMISTEDSDIHWELLHDGDEFWGIKYPISRCLWILHDEYRAKTTSIHWERKRKQALVIAANPERDIPEALKETEKLLEWLGKNGVEYNYLSPDEATIDNVLIALESEDYDMIHYAGHIRPISKNSKKYALLLKGGRLSSDEIERSAKPCKMVFLNGCESAAGIESFAKAFLRKGTQLVIGTLFRTNDKGARIFAEKFYEFIFQGEHIGESLKKARSEVREISDYGATWTSFVMYGDPG
jgi:hypothetical protein